MIMGWESLNWILFIFISSIGPTQRKDRSPKTGWTLSRTERPDLCQKATDMEKMRKAVK